MGTPAEHPSGVVGQIRDALQLDLQIVRPLGWGQGRTYLCRAGSDPVVVKWGLDPGLPGQIRYTARQVGELRRRGVPVPAMVAHGPLPGRGYAWVQEWLPGRPGAGLSRILLAELIELIGRCTDAPESAGRGDFAAWMRAVVFADAAGWWAAAQRAGPEVGAFCRRLRSWVGEPATTDPRHDYVHCDLSPTNVLVAGGHLSAVIDLENLCVGDGSVDVAHLLFEWHHQTRVGPAGLAAEGHRALDALGTATAGEAGWRLAVAYDLVVRLGWHSEHGPGTHPATLLPVCRAVLDALS